MKTIGVSHRRLEVATVRLNPAEDRRPGGPSLPLRRSASHRDALQFAVMPIDDEAAAGRAKATPTFKKGRVIAGVIVAV